MQVIAWMIQKPYLHLEMLVVGIVVQYQVQVQFHRYILIDMPQKTQELLLSMARIGAGKHFAVSDV